MAKANTKAKAKAAEEDDLLAGKANGKAKPAAKKSAAKAKGGKKASAEDVDDILETKASAKSKGNGKAKPTAAKKSAKKKETAERAEDIAATDDVEKALLKLRKATSYADIHERTGFNIRQIRRTARRMRDNGELAFTKEGTQVLVQVA